MPKIVHFEIPAENPAKAMKFYKEVFGWKFSKWDGPVEYWFTDSGEPECPGIEGAIAKKSNPHELVENTFGVDQIDPYLEKIKTFGGEITKPKHAIPGVGWFAQFKDVDGNVFGIMQDDPTVQ